MDRLPGLTKNELTSYIRATLMPHGLWSQSAENLLLGTCAQESNMGKYVVQMGGGPAIGVFQMEPATYKTILNECDILRKKPIRLPLNCNVLIYDMSAAIMATRLKYCMVPKALPDANRIYELAEYWKKYYNTELGKGTISEFMENYKLYIGV